MRETDVTKVVLIAIPLVLLAAMAIVAAYTLLRRRASLSLTGEVCGRCGYPIRGLPSPVCPECGSDRREGGTLPESASPAGSSPGALWAPPP